MTGSYFDGRSAARQAVELRLAAEGLMLTRGDGSVEHWPFHAFRIQRSPGDRFLRFERRPYRGECVLVESPADVATLLRQLRQSKPSAGGSKRYAALLLVACLTLGVGLWAGFPFLVAIVARLAPVSMEERLGQAVFHSLAPESGRLRHAATQRALDRVVARLRGAAGGPYTYRVAITRDPTVNAWAAPGGYVNVYCGLIQRLDSGDEMAAILAHEFQHVIQRHSTRNLVRTIFIRAALSLTGAGGDGLFDTAGMLGALHMMRSDEASADTGALALLQRAEVDPRAMAEAFGRIDRESKDLPSALKYISTHPPTASRIEAAKRAAASGSKRYVPVLTPHEWKQIQDGCYSVPATGNGK